MDQAQFWHQCELDFLRYSTEENEKLVVRWESTDADVWMFEGHPEWARAFKTLAARAGFGLTRKRGLDPWKDWLDALRRNGDDLRVPQTREALVCEQDRQARGLLAALERRRPGALAASFMKRRSAAAQRSMLSFAAFGGVISTPFKKSSLFCLELVTKALIEQESDGTITDQGFDWATFLYDPSIELGRPELDALRVQDEANSAEAPSRPKRGPKTDYATASRVAEIVESVAPGGDWRSNLDDILGALDDAKIPTPKTWRLRYGYRNWYAAVSADSAARGRHLAIEAIKHHLKLAKERPTETIP
jgi:hypothetical protein